MAINKKWVDFTNMGATVPAAGDDLALVDISDTTDDPTGTSKRWEWLDFLRELFATRFGADAGSTDTYAVTLTPVPAAYVTGGHYRFKANTANTGACTVNFNSLGAKTIKKAAGGITTDLVDNDIRAGQWVDLVYDGTNMQMQSLLGNAPAGGSGGIGDVVGPSSATDNAIARFDSTTGKLIQNSTVTLDDNGVLTVPEVAAPSTPASGKVSVYAKSDGLMYSKDDAGTETTLGGGAGSIAPLVIEDANTVAQRNGGTSQTTYIYKTFTDASNYERMRYGPNGSIFEIGAESAGTGTQQDIRIRRGTRTLTLADTTFYPSSDGAVDLGQALLKFNEVWATNITTGASGYLRFFGTTKIKSPSDGTLTFLNNAENAFTMAQLGGTSSNFPALKRSNAAINIRLADDSAFSFLVDAGRTFVSSQFDKTDVTLANITGLSAPVTAGKTYAFEALLFVDADVIGGSKYAIAGTATATAIKYEVVFISDSANSMVITSRQTALGGSAGQAGTTAGICRMSGTITVNAAGTLTVQFAQNAANGTSSVLTMSKFNVWQLD